MEQYNSELHNILIKINNFITTTHDGNSNVFSYSDKLSFHNLLSSKHNDINCDSNDNSSICKLKTSLKQSEKHLSDLISDPNKNLDNLFNKLNVLDNKIQNETIRISQNYNDNSSTLLDEQNTFYENIKFNNTYLFLFNICTVFIIIGSSFYKKTY